MAKITRHILLDVVVIAICGMIGGAEDWVSIASGVGDEGVCSDD
jgi:hypothetical protein